MRRSAQRGKQWGLLCLTLLCLTTQAAIIASPSGFAIRPVFATSIGNEPRATANLLTSASRLAEANETTRKRISEAGGQLPLCFEAGDARTDPQVRFVSRAPSCALFLTDTEAVMVLPRAEQVRQATLATQERTAYANSYPPAFESPDSSARADALRMKMVGANPRPLIEGVNQLQAKTNYFVGSDPARWRSNVARFSGVKYREIYPGIDLIYQGDQNQFGCKIVLKPGADPRAIRLRFEGAGELHIDSRGDLVMQIGQRETHLRKPVIYQETGGIKKEIAGRFALNGEREVRFAPGPYDTRKPLVADSILNYSTYFGRTIEVDNFISDGVFFTFRTRLFSDSRDNLYLVGETISVDFPTTENAFPKRMESEDFTRVDIVVSKIDTSKTGNDSLVFSTYFGGSENESLQDAFVDPAGNVFLVGDTNSSDFPTTESAFDRNPQLGSLFIAKLDTSKSGRDSLVYSTYFGVGFSTSSLQTFIDSAGSVYIMGSTISNNFPTTENAFQRGLGNATGKGSDAFISKIDTSKSGKDSLVYSTYLGGNGSDGIELMTADLAGNIYLVGKTSSQDFPTTANAFQREPVAASNSFVSRIDVNRTGKDSLVYSSFLGANSAIFPEGVFFRKVLTDAAGNIYLTGRTASDDFPVTDNAFQKGPLAGKSTGADGFVSMIDTSKSGSDSLVYSSYLGGDDEEFVVDLFVTASRDVYLTGETNSNNFPTTASAFERERMPGRKDNDVFVARFDTSKSGNDSLVYSSYLGGSSFENFAGSFVDLSGNVYVVGDTTSNDFPATENAFDKTPKSKNNDVFTPFIFRIDTTKSGQSSLIYSTLLGGSDFSFVEDFYFDHAGNAYILGTTASDDFPTHLPAQAINGGFFFDDMFVTKLDAEGRAVYSTYLGGRGEDVGRRLAVDSSGNACVFGITRSPDMPVTQSGYKTARPSDPASFIARIVTPRETGGFGISNVSIVRDTLLVVGEGFLRGAVIQIDGKKQSTSMSKRDSTVLMSESAGSKIKIGRKAIIRVKNPDGRLSEPVEFTHQKRRIL